MIRFYYYFSFDGFFFISLLDNNWKETFTTKMGKTEIKHNKMENDCWNVIKFSACTNLNFEQIFKFIIFIFFCRFRPFARYFHCSEIVCVGRAFVFSFLFLRLTVGRLLFRLQQHYGQWERQKEYKNQLNVRKWASITATLSECMMKAKWKFNREISTTISLWKQKLFSSNFLEMLRCKLCETTI